MRTPRTSVSTLFTCLTLVVLSPATAGALDFFVTSSLDVGDPVPGNGICDKGGNPFPVCTLRAAVEEANAYPGGDRIVIGERTIITGAQMTITDHLTIEGAGSWSTELTSDDSSPHRLFEVKEGIVVVIRDLTIREFDVFASTFGAAIWGSGFIGVQRVWFDRNSAHTCGAISIAGGAQGLGSIYIEASTFSYNRAAGTGGALCVQNGAQATVVNTSFVGNEAGTFGGAIYMLSAGGSLDLFSSTLARNVDTGNGSAIYAGRGAMHVDKTLFIGSCFYDDEVTVTSNGGNIESPGNTCLIGTAGDLPNLTEGQVALSQIGDWGGPVPTMLPWAASAAVNPPLSFATCPLFDARGEVRFLGCDVGAVERQLDDPHDLLFTDGFETGETSRWSMTSGT